MRRSVVLRALAALVTLQACTAEPSLEVETGPVAASGAALAPPFDPLACTLGSECARWGELIAPPEVPASECVPLDGAVRPMAWHALTGRVPCAFGSCRLMDAQIVAEPNGQLLAVSRIELPSTMVRGREVGLWLARYGRDGSVAGSTLWDFAIPPPGVEVQRHASLLSDASGDPLLVSARAVLPADAPRPLTVARLAGRTRPVPKAPSVSTPPARAERAAIGGRGQLLVASVHQLSDQPDAADDRPLDALFRPLYPQRALLALHDRHGRLLWNRPWLAGDASTEIDALHMGRDGQITVRVAADRGPLLGSTVARLDREGRVLWQRHVAEHRFTVQSAVDQQGNVYVLSTRWGFDAFETRFERLDAAGRSTGAWALAALGFNLELHAGVDRVWITARTDVGTGSELWTIPFDAGSVTCQGGERYAWADAWEDFFDGALVLVESETSELYIANSRLVAKVAGGMP
jgi:hypothetical protein